jgi:thioredoxin-related protein
MNLLRSWVAALCLLAAATLAGGAAAQVAAPHAVDIPRWFAMSMLDLKDEVPEAARAGKRVLIYFGQDGCPYCKALMKTSFGPGPIADRTQRHFTAIAINIWGDLEVTWTDGRRMSEKEFARLLKVQFTPTLLFLEADGSIALRLNGYLPPERMDVVLDWVIQRRGREVALADYVAARLPEPAAAPKLPRPYLMADPSDLARAARKRPLVVLFESDGCKACDEMHDDVFARPPVRRLLAGFDVARVVPGRPAQLVTPDGRRVDARTWTRDLRIDLHPTAVLFDAQGREAFRFDGHLRGFHVESALEYVAGGAWRSEPEFQRFVQSRAERKRASGKAVELMR